jgi:excisionase family DNA binding protein
MMTVGVDTHTDVHVAAVLDPAGRLLETRSFPATTRGYAQLLTWAESFGQVGKVGVQAEGLGAPGGAGQVVAAGTPSADRCLRTQIAPGFAAQPSAAQKGGPVTTPGPLTDVKFLTVHEVALIVRLSKVSVYRLLHSGELEAVRVGRSFRVPEQAVVSYLHGAAFTPAGG